MFRRIITNTETGTIVVAERGNLPPEVQARANALFSCHPYDLNNLMEIAYSFSVNHNRYPIGDPRHKSDIKALPESWLRIFPFYENNKEKFSFSTSPTNPSGGIGGAVMVDHLMYACLIESTNAEKVIKTLIEKYVRGDLEIDTAEPIPQVMRTLEMFLFNDRSVDSTFRMESQLRPDMGATRRNAYYRMFGFSLPADTLPDGKPYPFYQPKSSNSNFRRNFERFCEEVWVGIVNHKVTSGARPIDDESIQFHAFEMQKNFLSQRNNGDINIQEFAIVSRFALIHLLLEYPSPFVKAFGINEQSPAQRLFALANIAGVPANGVSESLFRLADPMSLILTLIETGLFNNNARILYDDTIPGNTLPSTMLRIISSYENVTGKSLKGSTGQNITNYPLPKGTGISMGGNQTSPGGNGAMIALPSHD